MNFLKYETCRKWIYLETIKGGNPVSKTNTTCFLSCRYYLLILTYVRVSIGHETRKETIGVVRP